MVEGPEIESYERTFARYIGTKYAFSFISGRVGLYGILKSLGIKEGDEVILQVPTHVVVANAIRYTGAKPVFVDCNLRDFNIDIEKAKDAITQKTKAIIVQHTFGIPPDMDEILTIAGEYGLWVIEDCVHALGATYKNKKIGSIGKAAFFSTEETKVISTTMGGMVTTDDKELAERLYSFQQNCSWPSRKLLKKYLIKFIVYYLFTWPYLHRYIRGVYKKAKIHNPLPEATSHEEAIGEKPPNYELRLSNAQAVLGLNQIGRINENLRHRRKIASIYEKKLKEEGVETPVVHPEAQPSYVRYPLWVQDRQKAIRMLSKYTSVGTWFTSVLEEASCVEKIGYARGSCPNAENASRHLINLPTHMRVTEKDAYLIAEQIADTSVFN